jgi:NAD(P)-dependent dehydrogenase (short-subunit alcohol dehydrogenase family)
MTTTPERRVAWVTGAASGIGAATARRLAADGASVACLDVDAARLETVVADIRRRGGSAAAVALDVTDAVATSAAAERLERELGWVEVVVLAAGIVHPQADVVDLEPDVWQRVLDVNLTGVFLTLRAAIPQLRRRGRGAVIAVASTGGLRGSPGYAAYVSAKHGLVGLVRCLANELAPDAVRVNAVCPGSVDTPMLDRQAAELGLPRADAVRTWAGAHLVQRLVTADEVAASIAWLAGDSAEMLTGLALPIDGGALARPPT